FSVFTIFFFFLTISPPFASEVEIPLWEQAAIDLCSYPSLREGVIDILYLYVDELWHEGQYSKIFPVLKLITTISPQEVEAWTLGGWFLINGIAPQLSGKEKEKVIDYAIDFMKQGIKANPGDQRIYMELAMYYYNRQDYESAISYLEKIEPEIPSYHFLHLKAHTYQKLGKKKEAIEVWERIKNDFPSMTDVADRFIMELKDGSGQDN
ncbi:MAG: CDC27 family protein, partial [Candidatus Ratteibacteria bacterium]|nr:CDC27 family protein [Candidatus Ratteibacteria bacterium]